MNVLVGSAAMFVGALLVVRLRRRGKSHVVSMVRESCAVASQRYRDLVTIHHGELSRFSKNELLGRPPQWDEFDWHCSVKTHGMELTARYVFVLDALNYCFWQSSAVTGLEYENLARGLRKACDAGEDLTGLSTCTEERLKGWLEQPHEFPLFNTRVIAIRALGRAFDEHGDAIDWVRECRCSAAVLVDLVRTRLETFRDETYIDGTTVYFYKRAQILVADIWAAFGQTSDGIGGFYDIGRLTMFADYRVPQLLRDLNIIEYSPELARIVDTQAEIERNSREEVAIRAATVYAVELIRLASGGRLSSVEVDWILWQQGEAKKNKLRPHHRTLTTCY